MEDRQRILQMVSDGTIDASQGIELLNALKTAGTPDQPQTSTGKPNWFRVRVTDLNTGRAKVNVNLPFGLIRAGVKIGKRFSPEMEDVDWDEIINAIHEGASGKLVDVEDIEGGEKVEVFVD
ncbi:MAG: hypothetical protein JXA09_02610 [Anaerolineae bacterium]|nr:hypothetical protein [Anaerolineae bacterium]